MVSSGSARLALRLAGYGSGRRLQAVSMARPVARGNRVAYDRGGLVEWYANGPLGLEQGFTIPARPAGAGDGALKLSLAVSGNVRAVASSGGVTFSGQGVSLAYGGLVATDARGRRLPARMRLQGGRLVLAVDARGARYPVRVDPLLQQAKLTASDGALGVLVGWSVAVSADGSTVAVGAPLTQDSVGSGAVYVFARPPAGWASEHEVAKLTPSDDGLGIGFSAAISADGSTIVTGAPTTSGANLEQGAAYVFTRPPGGWTSEHQAAELTASDGGVADMLGQSVAISGRVIVAGAPEATVAANEDQGAAYVFVEPPGNWANAHETAKLTASSGAAEDALGQSVAISGDTVVAGAPEAVFGVKSGRRTCSARARPRRASAAPRAASWWASRFGALRRLPTRRQGRPPRPGRSALATAGAACSPAAARQRAAR